jgi:hypothetical protein
MSDEKQAKPKGAETCRARFRRGGLGIAARWESADGQMLSVTHYLISAIVSVR